MENQRQRADKQTIYLPAHFYLLRAPALPAQMYERLSDAGHTVSISNDDQLGDGWQAGLTHCSHLLRELALRPDIALAVAVASPALLIGLGRMQREEGTPARKTRAYASLLRYLIRMSTRPTPFGLFSGVALGTYGEKSTLQLGIHAIGRFRTRPDMDWLQEVLRELEKDRSLVAQLSVRLNQTAYLVGERAVLPCIDTYGKQDNRSVSLRATGPVRKVFELANQFVPWTRLCDELQSAFPRASSAQIDGMLWQLWDHGFLISQLHPPLTDAQPIDYVRAQMETLHGVDALKAGLSRVLELGQVVDQAGIGASLDLLARLRAEVEAVLPRSEEEQTKGQKQEKLPLQVDAALHLQGKKLHRSIGQAAARAAEFLLRQTPFPQGSNALREYRRLFLEKYGEQAQVPLLDLLSPENGLDAPTGYEKPRRAFPRPATPPPVENGPRDQILLGLLAEALNKRSLMVELTEEVQQGLERWAPKLEEAPLSLEMYLQLQAPSLEAIDRGEWTAVVGRNCGSPHAGRTFGRFFDLLGEPGMQALRDLAAREEAILSDVIFAELSYQPTQARLANVAIRPPIRGYEIAVGTTPTVSPERVLQLSDLVVGIEGGRFTLRAPRLGKEVRVCQSHMLNPMLAPNVCRFLTEIANDGQPALSSFDWGAASGAPFLPRLFMRIGPAATLVLTPACWYLEATTILPKGEGSEEVRWFRGLQQWREVWRVPRYVYLSEMDNRLLLDLEHPLMVEELRDEVRKLKGHVRLSLEELLPDLEHLWLQDQQGRGYFCEIVTPILRADALAPVATPPIDPPQRHKPRERALVPSDRSRYPGEDWVYLKLYAAPTQHEELIAGPLREMVRSLQEQELIDRWFFLRYADPEPHLRLRFHCKTEDDLAAIYALVLPWGARLARSGQIQRTQLDTYEREVERYGGPDSIDLLEQVFTADSTSVSALIAAQYARHLTLDPLAVAIWTLDQLFAAWGWDLAQRLTWTQKAAEKYAFSAEFRKKRNFYCDVFAPRGEIEPALVQQRALLLKLVEPQETYLAPLRAQIRELIEGNRLWVPEESLLSSLAHMHLNRLQGLDRILENQTYAFWRHTLESLQRRPGNHLLSSKESRMTQ